MTVTEDHTTTTNVSGGDKITDVALTSTMSTSFVNYAMSVIIQRSLPDVRDGLKPVHRRSLYAMYDAGFRPDRAYVKNARVVGEIMGNYHPHGDSSIYEAVVRMAQPWSIRQPLIDGQGNFGSQGNDPAAAMRYCVTGDTQVRFADGTTRVIADIAAGHGVTSWGEADVDLKVLGARGEPVTADKVFHSGEHPVLTLRASNGLTVTGTHNHPVLVLSADENGRPIRVWKTLDQVQPGEYVHALRTPASEQGEPLSERDADVALLLGSWISEGWYTNRAGFNNTDGDWFDAVLAAYQRVVGGPVYTSNRTLPSGLTLHEIDVQDLAALDASPLAVMKGRRSGDQRIPASVWSTSPVFKRRVLQAMFEGDGSVSLLPRNTVQIAYSTKSADLAHDVQQLLLEFGVVSSVCRDSRRPDAYRTVVTNQRDARLFATHVGFLSTKQAALVDVLSVLPETGRGVSRDRVPFLASWLRATAPRGHKEWLRTNNIDAIDRWERDSQISDRLTSAARAVAEPLADGTHFYARVDSITPAGVAPVYSLRIANDEHAFITNGLVSHNTESRMTPLAMELVRDIDEETVDFQPNYDGKTEEPKVLPARFPNLLVNGTSGIAVGMATNIPTHNLFEVNDAAQWYLANPTASDDELLDACMQHIQGPDFPTGALIAGRSGVIDYMRTGRGSIRMRAVIDVEEIKGRTVLVVKEIPYGVNKDTLLESISEKVEEGVINGIADINDQSSSRTGLRLEITLRRDAVAKVVLNNLYKHSALQTSFGANMVSIVDGIPRTLNVAQMLRYWVEHQIDVIVRRTTYRKRKAEERDHILQGYLKALDALDEVIALIRKSKSTDDAKQGLISLLGVDEVQATAILDMQLRRLAALEAQKITDEHNELVAKIADCDDILGSPERQRSIIAEELAATVEKHALPRATRIIPFEGDLNDEDFIVREDVVVTITRSGYAKRTKSDLYRSQKRGGKGVRGASLREDDLVEHFFVTSTHDTILFFTNQGRVYRAKAYELQEAGRDAKGQHVANILGFQPEEAIAQVLNIPNYEAAPYLVLATKNGLVKKTKLSEYNTRISGGLIAVNLRDGDELVSAALCSADDDLLLVTAKGQAARFNATDENVRPMGRNSSGVTGVRFRDGDSLLAMRVVSADETGDVFVATSGGYAKRTPVADYPVKGRGGLGVVAVKTEGRGDLVGALIVAEGDEVFAITSNGGVIRTPIDTVRSSGRSTMGVRLINLKGDDAVLSIARNPEDETAVAEDEAPAGTTEAPAEEGTQA